jgi:L-seryl-tRNA(Ser) seleniumtransferase
MDLPRRVNTDPRRALPSIHRLTEALLKRNSEIPRWAASEAAQRVVTAARRAIDAAAGSEEAQPDIPSGDSIWLDRAFLLAQQLARPRPQTVINATGVVLHTNLGRAPIAPGAAEAAARAAGGYTDLELDIVGGRRGDRLAGAAERLRLLTGAEAAYVCNNNAAALVLALNTLAEGREVVVSRGELVEIGGSFRVPEIMERAGVQLVEVGSTNRTHLRDYADAIGPQTAMFLKIHRSNFEIRGFVKEVGLAELVGLGATHGVHVVEDLGSGTLVDLGRHGFPAEAFVPSRLAEGPDLVCFSGDKLLGGPQAGIVVGRAAPIAAMRKNPLARALRLDKMSLAALDWTLTAYLDGRAEQQVPVLKQVLLPPELHEARTRAFAKQLLEAAQPLGPTVEFEVVRDRVPVGGGSLPGFELESWGLAIRGPGGADALASRLRGSLPPILARVRDGMLLIDLRAVDESQTPSLLKSLVAALH